MRDNKRSLIWSELNFIQARWIRWTLPEILSNLGFHAPTARALQDMALREMGQFHNRLDLAEMVRA